LLDWARFRRPVSLRSPHSPRLGGCTFAEDPALSCAHVLPIWSAAADPRVVAVRAIPFDGGAHVVNSVREIVRMVRSCFGEHLLLDCGGMLLRFDVIEGSVSAGRVSLHFDLPEDKRLEGRIAAIRAFAGTRLIRRRHLQLASRLQALHAADARALGASLKEIAELVIGPGDWPGDGEYRKSLVRRLIATGHQLVRAGPIRILAS
jgi:hypothetical protein